MKHSAYFCAFILSLFSSIVIAQPPTNQEPPVMKSEMVMDVYKSDAAINLRLDMRKLWEDHITYTRNYIISALANLEDQDAVTKRLLKNQDDIGDAVKPYYGQEAGKKLALLLRDHIKIAGDVVKAAKEGNKDQLQKEQKKWSDNGKEIASFLSAANPNWSKEDLEKMLQKHLDFTTNEVVGRLKKDWKMDIKAYDDGHQHMLMFSDVLSDGIVKQFPDKMNNNHKKY